MCSDSQAHEERLLVERCARGDEAALRLLVARYEGYIFNFARRMLGNREDAEDVAVETFVRLWRTAANFRGDCRIRSYLCRITINLCRDHVKRMKPQPLSLAPPSSDPLLARISEAMHALDHEDRELLTLYYMDTLSYEELGDMFEISYDVLRTRLVRARRRLRETLGVTDERT